MKKIVRQMGTSIARLFRPRGHAMSVAVESSHDPRDPARTPQSTAEAAFFDKLKTILSNNGGAAQAGRINVIGLDRIKARLGDRWDQLKERVHTVARAALQKCLHPNDVWTACGNGYVIAFSDMSIPEAQTKCRMIAQIIETALLGEGDRQGLCVAATIATVDGQVLLQDLPALDAMLAQAPAITPAGQPTTAPSGALPPVAAAAAAPAWTRMHQGLHGTEEHWALTDGGEDRASATANSFASFPNADRMTGAANACWTTAERLTSTSSPWPGVEEDTGIRAANPVDGPGVRLAPPPKPLAEGAEPQNGMAPRLYLPDESLEMVAAEEDKRDEIAWEPLWDVRHQRIPIYRARYVRNSRAWLQGPTEEMLTRADFALREGGLRELTGCMVQSRYILLGLPVRFWTIASYAPRRDYLAAFAQRVSPASRKFLLLFITDVPDGVPVGRLLELLSTLRRYCREVVIETIVNPSDFSALNSARVFAVGTDLTGSSDSERVQMLQIDRFARGAAKAGIANCCLAGVESVPLVTAAIAAGFRYISGPAVATFGPQVSNVRPLGLDYIYRANLEAKGLQWPEAERGAERGAA